MGYRTWLFVLAFTIAVLALTAALSMPAASAAVLTVDTTTDDVAKSACDDAVAADCSLRGAIIRANGLSEASTILVPAGTYSLTTSAPCNFRTHQFGTFSLNTISLCLAANITLVGAGADTTIIDANKVDRVVAVSDYTVEIRDVTLRNGTTQTAGSFDGVLQGGGGINNGGTLTLVDSVVSGNSATLDGGGIFNGHTLFINRSKIIGNTSAGGGGGITNESYFEVTALSIQDSTIANNIAVSRDGGGVFNFGGAIAIAGSTISGNQAAGLGGGIQNVNNSAAIQIVNSTISGNSSGSAGGGIQHHSGTLTLNNVTITNNTSATNHAGEGGGIAMDVPVTVSNTVIAGNHDANGGAPDCSGMIASAGYNLIQTTTNLFRGFLLTTCNIAGDTTGNIIGQDPLLGVLADNGGPTETHALAAGSPALDGGNPDQPGTGAGACAITDQRALFRPNGARCDIGAVERSAAFSIANIQPAAGGNKGTLTARIGGGGFVDGATVRLRRSGQADIVGERTNVDVGGSSIATTFDLNAAAPGTWDVVVTNGDSTSNTLSGAFTITTGVGPSVWVDVVGMIRRHGPSTIMLLYGNRGDNDAIGVPLSLALPNGYGWARSFDITPPPPQGELRPDWNLIAESVGMPGENDFLNVPLFLPVVRAGYSGALRLTFTLPANATPTVMLGAAGDPIGTAQDQSPFVDQAVAGAQTYLAYVFGVGVPASVVSDLRQYAATQVRTMLANGLAAFTATLGTAPQIYSLGHLQFDLFLFMVPRVPTPATPSTGS